MFDWIGFGLFLILLLLFLIVFVFHCVSVCQLQGVKLWSIQINIYSQGEKKKRKGKRLQEKGKGGIGGRIIVSVIFNQITAAIARQRKSLHIRNG